MSEIKQTLQNIKVKAQIGRFSQLKVPSVNAFTAYNNWRMMCYQINLKGN